MYNFEKVLEISVTKGIMQVIYQYFQFLLIKTSNFVRITTEIQK